ncbi:hypothetical protein PoB_002229700 [Plakobranchus ocellatus]|uniref:Uncharacterized protein n=1 Tax=Plakobranchus ocellatus TaxID=259542 RepID=A0AAV3ZKK2_9GAST|nr:hypothetical protein PoB_002229700 [Plakobranchus ocellatus]
MMDALLKTVASMSGGPNAQEAAAAATAASGGNGGNSNNDMLANIAKMFPQLMPAPPPTTTTPAPPVQKPQNAMPNGFLLVGNRGAIKSDLAQTGNRSPDFLDGSQLPYQMSHHFPWPRGVGDTVASEPALRSAGILLSRVRAPPLAPWSDRGSESLR